MNAKIIAAICLLGGLLAGYKLGQGAARSTVSSPPRTSEPAPAKAASTAIAKPSPAREPNDSAKARISMEDLADRMRTILETVGANRRTADLAALLATVPNDRIPELARLLRGDMNGSHAYTVAQLLLPRWAEMDPVAAMEFAKGISNANRRQYAISSVFGGWARTDLEGALAAFASLPSGTERNYVARALISEIASKDPRRALQFIETEGLGNSRYAGEFANVFAAWGRIDPATAAAEAMKLPANNQRTYALRSALSVWVRTDPEAAYQFASSLPPGAAQRAAMTSVLGAMVEEEPQRAARLATEMTGTAQRDAINSVAHRWAAQDLDAAVAWMRNLPDGPAKRHAVPAVAARWASVNPQAAAEYADQLPPGSIRNSLISTIASSWSQTDGEAALAWVDALPASSSKNTALYSVVSRLAYSQPAKAAEWVESISSGYQRTRMYDNIARRWAEQDPDAAREWAVKLPPGEGQRNALREIANNLAGSDPEAAAKFATGFEGGVQTVLVEAVAGNWANSDPGGAMDWIKTLPDGVGKEQAYSRLFGVWDGMDPASAAAAVMDIETKNKESIISNLATQWAKDDVGSAVDWVNSIQDNELRNRAISGMISGVAQNSGETAATLVANLPPGKQQDDAANIVMSRWSSSDPNAAANWVSQFPEGSARDKGMKTLFGSWGRNDAYAAAEFLDQLPDGKSRQGAIEAFVDASDSKSPEVAAAWVTQLDPDDRRTQSRKETIARYWLRYDRDAASKWMNEVQIPADRQEFLLKQRVPGSSSYRTYSTQYRPGLAPSPYVR